MSENFNKIKRKYKNIAIIAGCILGVCCGIALTCVLAVALKASGVNFHFALYIPVAAALSAGAAFLFYLILKPDDKYIAKKLDKEFNLGQKAQTMVEYAAVEGAMPALQREQTNEVLGEVAKKRVSLKWLLKFAFIPVIAAAMLFAGIFVPAKKSGGYVEPGYTITDLHEAAVKNLISEVEGSSLETGLKTFTVLELNGLLDMLREADKQTEMKTAVVTVVHNVDALVAETNSYLKIDGVFKVDDTLRPFSRAVVNSVVNYKSRGNTSLTSMDVVARYEGNAEERIIAVLASWKNSYLAEYAPKAEGGQTGTPIAIADAAEKLRAFADALTESLADESLREAFSARNEEEISPLATAEGDALYNLYAEAAEQLSALAADGENGVYADNASYYNAIDSYLTSLINKLFKDKDSDTAVLSAQSYNCMMDDYLRNRLSKIFGFSRSEFGSNEHVAPAPDEDEGGGNNKVEDSGGYGPGNHIYGSNDKILDPDSGEAKSYGEYIDPSREENGTFLDRYKQRAEEYIRSGECSPEVAAYITRYFRYLENGLQESPNN